MYIGLEQKMNKIRLSKSSLSEQEKEAVCQVLDKEYLGMGEEVQQFENAIKNYLDTSLDVVCVNTGTAALHLALSGLGIGKGDEVLVPSLTYVASFQAISATGATPIACEVHPETLFLDSDDARRKITKKTKVIMPVHYASSSKGMEAVYALAKEFSLRVVEDAAQAFGSKRNGRKIGQEGDIICFSFDGIKNITSGEGGCIVSGDLHLVQNVKDARLLGVEKDTEKRFAKQRSWDFDVKEQGFRYHMSNIMAAIGIVQLSRIALFQKRRQAIVFRYLEELKCLRQVKILAFDYEEIMPHIFVICAEERDELKAFLAKNGIESGVHYKPNHLLSKYAGTFRLPLTEALYHEILTLPCHYDLSEDEQKYVIEKIKEFYGE